MRKFSRLTAVVILVFPATGSGQAQQSESRPSIYLADARSSDAQPLDADGVLRLAVERLESQPTIQAKLRQRVDLYGYNLVGSGMYLQQGRGARRPLRLELRMRADERDSSFQQVCDGRYLWTHQDLLGKSSLTRIDLQRVENLLKQSSRTSRVSVPLLTSPGGLPKLLEGLQTNFRFATFKPDELDGLPIYTLTGDWRPERLALLLPSEKDRLAAGQPIDPLKLPQQMPQQVVLKLGRDDYFPYRLEYWRHGASEGKESPGQLQSIVVMELFEVQLGGAIDSRQFEFKPGKLEFTDQTKDYLRGLGIDPDAKVEAAARSQSSRR